LITFPCFIGDFFNLQQILCHFSAIAETRINVCLCTAACPERVAEKGYAGVVTETPGAKRKVFRHEDIT
jgi:hypothetical protein